MNIPLFKVFMSDEAHQNLEPVMTSGYIGQGEKVEEFEDILKRYIKTPFINTLNSGTSGLHLAIHMIKSENCTCSRNEILTTPLTCSATNWPILANDLNLKWVDVDPNTCNIDLVDLERKITKNTLAIMVVHWGGYPCDLNELKAIQERAQNRFGIFIPIIEDCAHALGSTYNDRPIGSHGNHCMFSFQAIKHLTTGDGGMLVSPNESSYKRAKLLRWFGLDRESSAEFRCAQNIHEWGFKFQMNDISASIGISNSEYLDWVISSHKHNGLCYNESLQNIDGVKLLENKKDRSSSYWIYTMRVKRRDDFINKMKSLGIAVSRVHDRNDKHECVQEFKSALPGTDEICSDMICIPCGWWLQSEEIEYIVDSIKKGW